MAHLKTANRPADQPALSKISAVRPAAWRAVFATEEAYAKSVASVAARVRSGEVQPRVPDEEGD